MTTPPDYFKGRTASSAFTKAWIEDTSLQHASKPANPDTVDVSLAQELLDVCLEVLAALWPKVKSSNAFEAHQLCALKEVLGNLHLFAEGFQDRRLTCALSQSDELRDTVLEVLSDISQSILSGMLLFHNLKPRSSGS